jgi:quinol monooxygenase YgiN
MTVIVVATIYPEPKRRAEVIAALESTIARVHAEDEGCELYALHEGEDRLVMIEKWSSPDTLTAHGKGDAFAELSKQLEGKLTRALDVQVLQPHPAGTEQQGQL